ncbi:PepSY domain-containing protein [Streptomyces apricus]|uniref:PepSY domain-containing protein n=1 Tax=Streptomyces apricus TaxID=1828112 RepID=A0A5B0AZB4_9ACTN|nr:PepSY domain-containing protein [Streptomyces apricus]KAA0934676.1 PepSY domain-containing protein [Streptomyces apricus]
MKRNIVIATVAVAALVGGGTATALAVTGDDEAPAKQQQSGVRVADDDRDDRDDRDDDRNDSADDDRDDRDDKADRAEDAAKAKAAEVTAADAIRAALKSIPGTAVSADLDDEGSSVVWDVDVLSSGGAWHSVRIDPGTGKVLGSQAENDDDADDTAEARAALKGTSVTAVEAAEAGAAKGKVTSVDLDDDGRTSAWDVDTTAANGTEKEWKVDAKSAAVTADRDSDD